MNDHSGQITDCPLWWPLGASTLGSPHDPLSVMLRWLRGADARYVELRVGPGQVLDSTADQARRHAVRDEINSAGIDLLSVASYVRIGGTVEDDAVIDDFQAHLQLAADLGAGYLRVFPGAAISQVPCDQVPPLVEDPAAVDSRIVRRLAAIADAARDFRVRPVLETHDSHPRGRDVARVLGSLDVAAPGHPVGAIWDLLHPFRVGEDPGVTAASLAPYLTGARGYVQLKDVASRTVLTPVNPGDGIVPLPEIFNRLRQIGYRGPVSLEWERAWHPTIAALPGPLAGAAAWLNGHRPVPATDP